MTQWSTPTSSSDPSPAAAPVIDYRGSAHPAPRLRRVATVRRLLVQAGHRCASASLLLLVSGVTMSYLKSISGMPILRAASAALVLAFVAAHVSAVSGAIVWWTDHNRRPADRPLPRPGREARGIVIFSAVCLALGLVVLGLLHLGLITLDK